MKNIWLILLGALIVVVLILYTVAYQVRFSEAVVLTRFGKAVQTISEPGLHWKLPYPIQAVESFDTRVRILETRLEETQTLDKRTVIVQTYVAWRIAEPLHFYRTLGNVAQARAQLRARLRDAASIIGNFTFDQLVNTNPELLRLSKIEQLIEEQIQSSIENQNYGIDIEHVGIERIILPAPVTSNVFDRMRATRQRLAAKVKAQGEARAAAIIAEAKGAAQRIRSFAKRRAQAIRAAGEAAAAEYYDVFKKNQSFAIFLDRLRAYRKALTNHVTFILDADKGFLNLIADPPAAPLRGQQAEAGGEGGESVAKVTSSSDASTVTGRSQSNPASQPVAAAESAEPTRKSQATQKDQ